MEYEIITGFSSREKLIERLVNSYKNKTAPEIILLTGPAGCGKSFVVNNVVKKCEKLSRMRSYINRGDSFISPSAIGSMPKLRVDNLSLSAGFLYMSAGLEVGAHREESQYNHLKALLRSFPNHQFLFCLDGLSSAHSQVKAMAQLLLSHREDLECSLSSKVYFLVTDTSDTMYLSMGSGAEQITHFELSPYDTDDILEYLKSRHLELLITDTVKQNIPQIQKISGGNLYLADFLFVDLTYQNRDYFAALEYVINRRLAKLKTDGQNKEISESDMEDIILSSSLAIQPFTTTEISSITNRNDNTVATSLDIAKEEAFLDKSLDCFYDFPCFQIKSTLEKQSIEKRRERLLHYYQYYTENEQDEYYIYASRFSSIDFDLLAKIDDAINKYGTSEQKEDFQEIKDFYEMMAKSLGTQDIQELHTAYLRLKRKGFDVPLKAELSRAYFYYLYRTHSPYNQDLKLLFEECLAYANHEILLSDSANPIKLKPMDEIIVRLNIIYTVAPYLLDVLNRDDEFTELYKLSLSLSNACSSKSAKGLGQYIENVFNRKAFLFVNQTQCTPYYERAKSYFSKNQIWDEMCLTLVCQAGTDIVIQQYDDAQELCKQAQEIADRYGITLPQPEKLQNNFLIAEFLQAELQAKSEKVCLSKARQTISKLKKLLHKKPCDTEFVILTNICSLSLYCGNDSQYLKYKAMLERQMACKDVSDVRDLDIDDFYRYYFAWFEVFRTIRDRNWETAEQLSQSVHGFIPALFKKQEKFWEMKDQALADVIRKRNSLSAYDFCHNLVQVNRKENTLSRFFFRGLMLSDLQYTSYN